MSKWIILLLTAVLPGIMLAQQVINDPNAQVRQVSSFHAIKVSNGIDLFLSQDDKEAVAVSASKDEYRDRIRTKVEDGVLVIWFEEDKWWKNTGNKKLKAYISFKNLDKLMASGASDVVVMGSIRAGNLAIKMSGASDFKGEIQATSLDVSISGASDVTVKGTVTNLNVDASGASDFKGYDLQTEQCNVEASGASDIKITVNKELSARASGASDIHYKGAGVIRDLKTSGASSVSKRG